MSKAATNLSAGGSARRLPGTLLVVCLILPTVPAPASIQRDVPQLAEPRPGPGTYLVANEAMRDPRFRQSVILLIAHDDQGSVGLIINRPVGVPASDVFDNAGPEPLFFGGPVRTEVYSMLFRSDAVAAPDDDEGPRIVRLIDDVDFIMGFEAVTEVYSQLGAQDPHRIYGGYSGWGPGQLDSEIENGGWHLIDDSPALIFSEQPDRVWGQLMRKLRGQWI